MSAQDHAEPVVADSTCWRTGPCALTTPIPMAEGQPLYVTSPPGKYLDLNQFFRALVAMTEQVRRIADALEARP
jgi:hypothetical protein